MCGRTLFIVESWQDAWNNFIHSTMLPRAARGEVQDLSENMLSSQVFPLP